MPIHLALRSPDRGSFVLCDGVGPAVELPGQPVTHTETPQLQLAPLLRLGPCLRKRIQVR